jgi:3-hydroxyacyl-[acyl-carrier-protein] dehydratase
MRFSLVDRIVALEPRQTITAIKTLSRAEEYLVDHFPGFPVMPGVLMLEALVQAGAWLVRYTEDFEHSTILLKQARAVRFASFLKPGDTMTLSATLQKWDERECVLKGEGTVDGEPTVNARLTLERFNLAERGPEFAKSDQLRIEALREEFSQLWTVKASG